jgi:hypothetical protein
VRTQELLAATVLAACVSPSPAGAFAIYGPDLFHSPADAPRWTSERLAGGVRVGVDAGFVAAWGAITTDAAVVESWVEHAFAAWENAALQFDIHFGDTSDAELVLASQPGADPLGGFYGYATVQWDYDPGRVLTNGHAAPGYTIEQAQVDIAADRLISVGGFATLPIRLQGRIIVRLLMHEIGHTIGLGHANLEFLANWDTDLDPYNPMAIDPADPFSALFTHENRAEGTIMSNQPCGEGNLFCAAVAATELTFDDLGGRDVLYPVLVPEPRAVAALGLAAVALAARSRRSTGSPHAAGARRRAA